MKLADDVDLKILAERTHGYVGADLANLCTKAGLRCVRKMTSEMEMESGEIDINFLDDLRVTMKDFNEEIGQYRCFESEATKFMYVLILFGTTLTNGEFPYR